jgi:hypothetical protein
VNTTTKQQSTKEVAKAPEKKSEKKLAPNEETKEIESASEKEV